VGGVLRWKYTGAVARTKACQGRDRDPASSSAEAASSARDSRRSHEAAVSRYDACSIRTRTSIMPRVSIALVTLSLAFLTLSMPGAAGAQRAAATSTDSQLAPIRVSGSYWIELSPVVLAARSFYPEALSVGEGGITRITAGEADLATNAETQLLRESLVNPDLRIIMT